MRTVHVYHVYVEFIVHLNFKKFKIKYKVRLAILGSSSSVYKAKAYLAYDYW